MWGSHAGQEEVFNAWAGAVKSALGPSQILWCRIDGFVVVQRQHGSAAMLVVAQMFLHVGIDGSSRRYAAEDDCFEACKTSRNQMGAGDVTKTSDDEINFAQNLTLFIGCSFDGRSVLCLK